VGSVSEEEMYRTFNMGIGFAAIAPGSSVSEVRAAFANHGHRTWVIGSVTTSPDHRVRFV
jgi:phosphoribosylformylglycinamidine cyclo-ligase